MKIKTLAMGLLTIGALLLLNGCSVSRALNQPPIKNLKILQVGADRDLIRSEFGEPLPSSVGESCDLFSFEEGCSAWKYLRAISYTFFAISTLGLSEILTNPVEETIGNDIIKLRVCYDQVQKTAMVERLDQGKVIAGGTSKPADSSYEKPQTDNEGPDIVITSHDVMRGIQLVEVNEKTTIIGQVTDQSEIASVSINNEPLRFDQNGKFSREVILTRGVNKFMVTAEDNNKNSSSREIIISRKELDISKEAHIGTIPNWYQSQYAFVIGIDKYKNPNIPALQNAVNDSKSLSALLRQMNFTVYEVYNDEATKENIMNKLKSIQKTIGREDNFLMFFAGHGQGLPLETGKRTGYILPYDADIDLASESVIDYEDEAIPLETMKKITAAMSAKHVALLLDSCFSGLVMKRSLPAQYNITMEHYIDFLNRKAIDILTAGDDQPVSDGSGHSPFTMAILEGLQNKDADVFDRDGYVTIDELYTYVKERVEKSTDARQQPQFDNMATENGKFIFKVR